MCVLDGAVQSEGALYRWHTRLPMLIQPTSEQDDLATPVIHTQGRATATLTGRTAQTLFSPNPAHHASAAVPGLRASKFGGSFTRVQPMKEFSGLQRQCRVDRTLRPRAHSRHRARLACAGLRINSRYIPSPGLLTRSDCSVCVHLP